MRQQRTSFWLDAAFCLAAVVLGSLALAPFSAGPLFPLDDGGYHLYRTVEYAAQFNAGVPYPRWGPDFLLGQGLPVFNYYSPLLYYVSGLFACLGATVLHGLTASIAIFTVLASFASYIYARRFFSRPAALVASVAYVFAPYHLFDLYHRGALPEYAALAWLPLILWALHGTIGGRRWPYVLLTAMGLAGLILTHNVSALLFVPLVLAYALLLVYSSPDVAGNQRRGALVGVGAAFALGALLSAFYWLPALAETPLVQASNLAKAFPYSSFFVPLSELTSISPIHQYDASGEAGIGLFQALLLCAGLAALIWRSRTAARVTVASGLLWIVVGVITVCLVDPFSDWLWSGVPLLDLVAFPWRLLGLLTLATAFFAGCAVEYLLPRWRLTVAAGLTVLLIASSMLALQPRLSLVQSVDLTTDGLKLRALSGFGPGMTAAGEFVPKTMPRVPTDTPPATQFLASGSGIAGTKPSGLDYRLEARGGNWQRYAVSTRSGGDVVLPVTYFPGWQASVDGEPAPIAPDASGLTALWLPAGQHTVELRFGDSRVRLAANVISAASLFMVLALLGLRLRRGLRNRLAAVGRLLSGISPRAILPSSSLTLSLVLLGMAAATAAWVGLHLAYGAVYASDPALDYPLKVEYSSGAVLRGVDIAGATNEYGTARAILAGEVLTVTLWLSPGQQSADDLGAFARLTNREDQTWAYAEAAVNPALGQSDKHPAVAVLTLPPILAPGVYVLEVGALRPSSHEPLPMTKEYVLTDLPQGGRARVGPIVVRSPESQLPMATDPAQPVVADRKISFGGVVTLAGFQFKHESGPVSGRPGSPLEAVAGSGYWKARAGERIEAHLLWTSEQPTADWRTKIELLDEQGHTRASGERLPLGGEFPSQLWTPGFSLWDQVHLSVPTQTPPGEYTLWLQVLAPNGSLPVKDSAGGGAEHRYELGRLRIEPPADVTAEAARPQRGDLDAGPNLVVRGGRLDHASDAYTSGETLVATVQWIAAGPLPDLQLALRFATAEGNQVILPLGRPVPAYPTEQWRLGESPLGIYPVKLRDCSLTGDVTVSALLSKAETGVPYGEATLGHLVVRRGNVLVQAEPQRRLNARLAHAIALVGFDVLQSGSQPGISVRPGESLGVRLYWRADELVESDYTAFVQLLNPAGFLVAQSDAQPQSGQAPTSTWCPGYVVPDERSLSLPAQLPPGDYTLIAGMYSTQTQLRLSTASGDDHVKLGTVVVRSQ